ncbi:MAG TPA: response regulator [Terriglobales bacterium]|nr:response regulator [Terriglobales bacterium]
MTAPIVYFIDDSATMREVIKIAFRRENIDVVACHDGDTALAQMSQQPPDVVITDVIMPGKDGYEVCQNIKHNPSTSTTPVVLMSGVVNKQVAEKAFAVKADELIRKPFQPGDLIGRVKQLLNKAAKASAPAPIAMPVAQPIPVAVPQPPVMHAAAGVGNGNPAATLSSIFAAATRPSGNGGNGHAAPRSMQPAAVVTAPVANVAAAVSNATMPSRNTTGGSDVAKLRIEILRMEHLVKKLQSELEAEREYARALEEHIKTLQETE